MISADSIYPIDRQCFYILHDSNINPIQRADPNVKLTKLIGIIPFISSYKPDSNAKAGTLTKYEDGLFNGLACLNNAQLDILVQSYRDDEESRSRGKSSLKRFNIAITILLQIIECENDPVNIDDALAVVEDMTLEQVRRALITFIQKFFHCGQDFNYIHSLIAAYECRNQGNRDD